MKVNFDKVNNHKNNVHFEGYKPVKTNEGKVEYEFNFPFDSQKDDCYLEVYNVYKDKKGNYFVTDIRKNKVGKTPYIKLNPKGTKVDLSANFGLRDDQDFGYHYVIVPKGSNRNSRDTKPRYRTDAGDYIDSRENNSPHDIYNIVTRNKGFSTKGGAMKLVMPDFYNAMWTYNDDGNIVKNKNYDKKAKSSKTFSNKMGGNLAGIEKDVIDGKFKGYSRIISTPIFTDDSLTPHAYWNTNCMQMAQSLGNIKNYASLQREMFKKGLNFVSDGAFVNEGLQGVHFQHVLKWGKQSPYYRWFRAEGIEQGPLSLGVFSKQTDFVSYKVVNSPKDADYTSKKPTYLQIFDKRLVSDAQKNDKKNLITEYDKQNTESHLDINTHNDTVIPYHFEINPDTYLENLKILKSTPGVKADSFEAVKIITKSENYVLEEKIESGFETWDANSDIAKLSYVSSDSDAQSVKGKYKFKRQGEVIDETERKNYEVQDYAIMSGIYWTKKTNDILNQYVVQNLKNSDPKNPQAIYKKILQNIDAGIFPKELRSKINSEVIQNVLDGEYELRSIKEEEENDYNKLLLESLMDLPLDTIEFGDNLTAVLASPYITKRASNPETLGISRGEAHSKKNPHLISDYEKAYEEMDKVYRKEIWDTATEIIKNLNEMIPEGGPKIYRGNETTEYGKYVLPRLTEEITRFLVIKALAPDVKMETDFKTGEITYDYKKLKEKTTQSLNIIAYSPEDEALQVISKIKSGVKSLKKEDKVGMTKILFNTLKGTNVESYKLAEMIVDRLEAGLDWRIDAAKDIGDINDLKNDGDDIDVTWQKVTDFWKTFTKGVRNENPNAYVVAEITDEGKLHKAGAGEAAIKYQSTDDMIKKLLRESGMTSIANYSYYFSSIMNMFGETFENYDKEGSDSFSPKLSKRVNDKSMTFLKSAPLEALLYSYNFIGNHDKPRILHGLIMNTALFNTDLKDVAKTVEREKAYRILNDRIIGDIIPRNNNESDHDYDLRVRLTVDAYDFSTISPKAVAMAEAMNSAFGKSISSLFPHKNDPKKNEKILTAINKSICDLANGSFKGKTYDAEGFGVKPIEVAIDIIFEQAKKEHGLSLSPEEEEQLKKQTFEVILKPALGKLQAMMEFIAAVPGLPTLYAGDDIASTGYETETKNIYLQNRSFLHQEWLEKGNKDYKHFVKDHYDRMNKIMTMRARPEMQAMNDGSPFPLPVQSGRALGQDIDVSAILRQSPNGDMAISLFNTTGITHMYERDYMPHPVVIESVVLNNNLSADAQKNTPFAQLDGLTPGTIFRDAKNPNEKYVVRSFDGSNFLKKIGSDGKDTAIVVNGPTLTLYAASKKKKTLYNPKYNLAPTKRKPIDMDAIGKKLSLVSS